MPYFHVLVEHAATRNELSYVIRASSVALAKQEIDNRNLKMVSEMVYLGESKHVIPAGTGFIIRAVENEIGSAPLVPRDKKAFWVQVAVIALGIAAGLLIASLITFLFGLVVAGLSGGDIRFS